MARAVRGDGELARGREAAGRLAWADAYTSLVLAGKTVDRHVSNIYTKLGVSSPATAYQNRLL